MASSQAELLYKIKVDAADAVRQVEAVAGKIRGVGDVAANTGSKMGGLQKGVQNASYQFQDFIVQTSMGTDALRAFGQQAPQLLGGFGAAGAVVGVLAAILPVVITGIKNMGDASAKAANDLKRWTEEVEGLGKMGGEIAAFAKSITGTAADGFKDYVNAYNKASKEQRAEMEAWLKLKLEVEQAKLNDITSEARGRNIDFGTAFGGNPTGDVNYGPDNQRMVELGSQIRLQQENVKRLAAAVNGDFKTAIQGNAEDIKAAEKAYKEWEKAADKQIDQIQKEFDALEKLSEARTKEANAMKAMSDPMAAYNIALEKANVLLNDNKLSIEEYQKAVGRAEITLANSNKLVNGFGDALSNAFTGAMLAGKSFGDVMKGLATDIQGAIVKIMIIEPLIRNLKLAMVKSGYFGSDYNQTTAGFIGPPVPSANGNVFNGPVGSGSNVIPFASGGIVSRPTYFPMANGKRGLAGEAGVEGIIPLKRGADGKLGVSASGMSGGGTVVNVYNQGSDQVETKTRQDGNGASVIDVYIKKAVADGIASGQFDKAMGATYGLRRNGTR